MYPLRDAAASKKIQSEESGLEEEGKNALCSERSSEDVSHEFGVLSPIRAELEFHDNSRGDADGKGQAEDFSEKRRHSHVEGVVAPPANRLHDDQQPAEPDA